MDIMDTRGDPRTSNYFPMQKVRIRPDPSVYAGSSEFICFWRLTGDSILPTCPADRVRVT